MTTNKQLLIYEIHGDSNQCTPYRGNLIHTTCMLPVPVHVCDLYASCRQSPYVAIFCVVINSIGQRHCSWEKGSSDNISSTLADRSKGPHVVFLPHSAIEAVEKAKYLLMTNYIGLLGTYLQHVISTFNTCSWGPTHQSLSDMDGGYNLGGAGFPHHSPCPSQPTVLHFPLWAPPGLRLTILNKNLQQVSV
jgi:hypothetical protein